MKSVNNRHFYIESFTSGFLLPRRVDVYLPIGYDTNSDKKYPVLYAHDGQNLMATISDPDVFNTGAPGWNMVGTLEELANAGNIEEHILVGMYCTEARHLEYFPAAVLSGPDGKENLAKVREAYARVHNIEIGDVTLYSDDYLKFIVEELKPFIDTQFRTKPGPESTSLIGSSMGGLISLYGLLEYPGVFHRAACLSTHWPVIGDVISPYLRKAIPPTGKHRFYFDYGDQGLDALYEPYQRNIDALFFEKGYEGDPNYRSVGFPGHDHNESFWAERLPEVLKFILAPIGGRESGGQDG